MTYKEIILNIIDNHPKAYGHILHSSKNKYLIEWLNDEYPLLVQNHNNLNTFLYWLIHDLHYFPLCKHDQKPILKNAFSLYEYPSYCCRKCAAISQETLDKTHKTNIERYGVKCTFQTKQSWDNIHKSCKEKYGAENIWGTQFGKQRCKETRYKKYGAFESAEIKEKRKNTIISKYGGTNGNIFSTEYGKNKIRQTIFKRTSYFYQNQSEQDRIRLSKLMSSLEVQKKRYETLKKNNSFNTSKPEDICYNMLLFIYPHIIRQYTSAEYPFNCDFYDEETNTYFEYNGSWVHGGHFYDCTNINDVNKANMWKAKHTAYYDTAYDVWTNRDLLKYNTALSAHLNYVVFWNINDVMNFVLKKFN